MDTTQPTIVVPDGTLESVDINEQLSDITSSLTDTLAPIILLSLAITVLFIVMHIISMVRRRKLENALFDMQKTLHEMNERDKARSAPAKPIPLPKTRNDTIAAADSRSETNGMTL